MKTLQRLERDWQLATEIQKLEARLWRQVQRDGIQVVLFTSAVRGEGKSTTVAYLATAMGRYPQRRILALDLDFREPQLSGYFDVETKWGIDDVLQGHCGVGDAVAKTSLPSLDLLSATPVDGEPKVLLQTSALRQLFNDLRERYDLILVDAPALLPVADTSMIIPFVDGVTIVAMAGKTTKVQLKRARELCLGMGANLLGMVVGNLQEAAPEYQVASYYQSALLDGRQGLDRTEG